MAGFYVDIEKRTKENDYFCEVLFIGSVSQLVVMSLLPGEETGLETHPEADQFIRVEEGKGKAILDGQKYALKDGSAVIIPAGTEHNIINTSSKWALKLYSIYTLPEYPRGTIHKTKADVETHKDEYHVLASPSQFQISRELAQQIQAGWLQIGFGLGQQPHNIEGTKIAGYHTDLGKKTVENEYFCEVLFTSHLSQLVVMSLKPGEDIGLETYLDTDHFTCVEEGNGKAILDGLVYELKPGFGIVIPAGTEHNIINTSSTKALKLYTVYIPPDYADGTICETKSESNPAYYT